MQAQRKAWLQLHFCVLLWGFTAILGKLISLPAIALVFWRMLLVSGLLLLWPGFWRGLRGQSARASAAYGGIGLIIALHWVTFYGSVKLANASIGATCMALVSVFVALIEPIVQRRRFDPRELLFGLAVIPGVFLVVGGTPPEMRVGVLVGVISALLAAIFTTLNVRFALGAAALSVTGIELGSGAIALGVAGLFVPAAHTPWLVPDARDAALLVTLALACTLLPFTLSLVAMRRLSAFTGALAVNLEPVYAVILAVLLLGEQRELHASFYLGVAIVVGVVFGHAAWKRSGSA